MNLKEKHIEATPFFSSSLSVSKKLVVAIISGLFVLLFLYAAASKLIEYDRFQLQISKSPIITDFASVLVWMVPLMEIVISIMLLVNRTVLPGLYAALGLMCVFTIYIIGILNFAENIPCSCAGVFEWMDWRAHLVFNMVFIVIALIGIALKSNRNK
ncbi:MauE/DoxX family redox-associated membrane protein [Pedobacter sp. B4-66]|uniref:MauE/DoxX family redox-associated membrane protein n=1 Tax=Pedobacter sp. B4-66 TaxID=2817280 RepID=UPI001BDADA39|nr:MauE/DoxX family redox-associated membrane protein [Pedobacter sp. B4-66]